ncbi:MAG TPA: dihydrofolate reductase family protein [Microlunatus sp.]|nr:dihydrofolate reductase family protein [Microlunatus sp.]
MRKLVYLVASTLDGFIAETSRADPSGTVFELDGDHAAALTAEYPEMIPHHVRALLGLGEVENRHFDTVLEGRVSYQMALAQGVTNAYPHLRHLVFSTSMGAAPDPAIEIVSADALEVVRALKAEEGLDIWLCGGGSLAATLRTEIDEIHLKLNPVVLGEGAPLFDPPAAGPGTVIDRFRLISAQPFDSGVALMIYGR